MKNFISTVLFVLVIAGAPQFIYSETIGWTTSYEEALIKAKRESKPIVLFFTGSDWCSWCEKLEKELLETREFAKAAGDKFVFLRLDFPMREKQKVELIEQNKELQDKFDVKSFPSIILMAPNGRQIGITGYRKGDGQEYANHLLKMVENFSSYNKKIKQLHDKNFTGLELKHLYRKAKEFANVLDQNAIIKVGMESDRAQYFMMEYYRFLARAGKIHDKEATSLRAQLIDSDPSNRYYTHYQIACIEFNAYANEMEKEHYSVDIAVAPLVKYIENFGEQDIVNLWRINMIVSQMYRDKMQISKALKFATCAHDCAPKDSKADISLVIANLKANLPE